MTDTKYEPLTSLLDAHPPRKAELSGRGRVTILLLALGLGIALASVATDARADERYEAAARGGIRPYQVDLILAYFPPEQVDTAIVVMACESRGDPSAVGGFGEIGLMQIRPEYWQPLADDLFWPGASLFNPEVNIGTAAAIWREMGWWVWSCAR